MKHDYIEIRNQSLNSIKSLETEDLVVQTSYDVSPLKWHLGHTTWFFEQMLCAKYIPKYRYFHEKYNYIFNSYYNSLGERVAKDIRGMISRPTVKEILAYRDYVDNAMLSLFEKDEFALNKLVLQIGLNHEQQHQELMLYDIKQIAYANPIKIIYNSQSAIPSEKKDDHYFEFEEGIYEIGASSVIPFAYDNEFPRHKVFCHPFRINLRLITNGDYLEFMKDNGYKRADFWLDDGWRLINERQWNAPMYWEKIDATWQLWTLKGFQTLDRNAPVSHLSYYEADAFARWAGKRLPLESEWEIMAEKSKIDKTSYFLESGNMEAVQKNKENSIFGNLWQWTKSSYQEYPAYKRPADALGEYNQKFMSGQMVLRGGSYATAFSHYRHSYRNFFQADKRWLFNGLILAEDL